MLTFQLEPWAVYSEEAPVLWEEHYKELGARGKFAMKLDGNFYKSLEAAGQLMILTARRSGKLIGYVVMLVRKHPHYDMLCGFEDAYFVTRNERKAGVGRSMIEEALRLVKGRGGQKVVFHSKTLSAHRALFTALGFAHEDELWGKVL